MKNKFTLLNFKKVKIKLLNSKKVFTPNLTTQLLMESVKIKKSRRKIKILDLGSGTGIIGIYLKILYGKKVDIYFSDKSPHAIKLIKKNIKLNNISGIVKQSDIFKNWEGNKFDLVINDISAIDKNIAKNFWYNENIPSDCGDDGIKLTKKVLLSVKKYLYKNGEIYLPIISLSDHVKIKKILKQKFKSKLIIGKEWPAPKELLYNYKAVDKLKKKGYIFEKFNMNVCFTEIFKILI